MKPAGTAELISQTPAVYECPVSIQQPGTTVDTVGHRTLDTSAGWRGGKVRDSFMRRISSNAHKILGRFDTAFFTDQRVGSKWVDHRRAPPWVRAGEGLLVCFAALR